MEKIKVLSLFGGIGCFEMALERAGVPFEVVDYVDIDKYAVKSYNAIWGTNYEPQNIAEWDKDIEVDLVCHGSPCQSFSLAGLGEGGDKGSGTRSSLMWETVRIVKKLKPKYIIWENVKGLLTKKHRHNFDAYLETMDNLGYKNYYQIMNAKNYGTPQNRERVFTVSIRKDIDNGFEFPDPVPLTKGLKDVLEKEVGEKYYLSDKAIAGFKKHTELHEQKGNGFKFKPTNGDGYAHAITTRSGSRPTDNFIEIPRVIKLGSRWGNCQAGWIYDKEGLAPTLDTGQGGGRIPMFVENKIGIIEHNKKPKHQQDLVQDEEGLCRTIPAGTHSTPHLLKAVVREPKLEYIGGVGKVDRIGDGKELSRNYPQGNRVYSVDGIAVSLTANGGGLGGSGGLYLEEAQPVKRRRSEDGKKVRKAYEDHELEHSEDMREYYVANDGIMPTITASRREQKIAEPYIVASRGRGEKNEQQLEPNFTGTTNTITTVQKDNLVVEEGFVKNAYDEFIEKRAYVPEMFNPYNRAEITDVAPTQTTQTGSATSSAAVLLRKEQESRVRKLTPRECWRLQSIDDEKFDKAQNAGVSDSQLYKQAGNGIAVCCPEAIFSQLFGKN